MKLFSSALKYSAIVAGSIMAYLIILLKTGSNTMVMQLTGMLVISMLAMFAIVRVYLHSERSPYNFITAVKMGALGGLLTAILLLVIETILYAVTDVRLAPASALNSGLPYFGMQAMLAFGMVIYGIISSFACFQYFKRPLKGSRYRMPKSWITQEQH